MNKNLKNITSLFSMEIVVRVIAFGAVTYLARTLGKANFGLINIGVAVMNSAMILGSCGLHLLGTRKAAANDENIENVMMKIFKIRLLLSAAVYLFISAVLFIFVDDVSTRNVILIYILYLFPAALFIDWYFQGKQQMGSIAIARVGGMLAYFIFVVLTVKNADQFINAPTGWIIGGIVNFVLLLYLARRKKIKINFHADTKNAFLLLRESFPIAAASILGYVIVLFPFVYLGIVVSNIEVGIYSAAFRIVVLLLILDRVFNAVFFPKIVGQIENPLQNEKETFGITFKIVSAISLTVGMLAAVSSNLLIKVVFTTEYIEAVPVLQILILYFAFTLMSSVYAFTLIGLKKEKLYTLSLAVGGVFFIIIGIILTPLYKSSGIALALVIFEITAFFLMNFLIDKKLRLNLFRLVIIPLIVSVIISGLFLYYIDLPQILEILIAILIGVPMILIFSGIRKEEINFIKRILI